MNFAGVDFFNGPVNLSVPASVSFWIASMEFCRQTAGQFPGFFRASAGLFNYEVAVLDPNVSKVPVVESSIRRDIDHGGLMSELFPKIWHSRPEV